MHSSGKIYRISISLKKGSRKQNVDRAKLLENTGIENDAHAGSPRQVSLLPYESFDKIRTINIDIQPGDFAENITTLGLSFKDVRIGQSMIIGEMTKLTITHIGKECHQNCVIKETTGDCIMPREGIFAKVIKGGIINVGDRISWFTE